MYKKLYIVLTVFLVFLVGFSVLKKSEELVVSKTNECGVSENKPECWQTSLNETMNKKGLPATFDLLAKLYSSEPLFASECHGFAHEIGRFSYNKFSKNQNFDLNAKTAYCGYGFYHGFMESMLESTGSIKQAQDFCRYVGEKLANETTDGEGACYHGIGHGAVDGNEPQFWGNEEKMIQSGLNLCEKVAGDDKSKYGKLYRCVTGAYNAIEILSHDPKYKLQNFEKDPFSLCLTQKEEYKEGCYTNMIPSLLQLTQNDLLKTERYIENIKENEFDIRKPVTASLFVEYVRLNLGEPDQNISAGAKLCQGIADPLRLSCFYGLSEGFMKYGDPQIAYIKGLDFCSRSFLKPPEKDTCFNSILTRLRIWYSEEKSKEICNSVPEKYRGYCG